MPDTSDSLSVVVNPTSVGAFGRSHVLLRGRAQVHHVSGFAGPASIKSVTRGSGVWETAAGRYVVTPGTYLLLNADQPYSVTIESVETVETFCVFFRERFLQKIAFDLTSDPSRALDDPAGRAPAEPVFFETLHPCAGDIDEVGAALGMLSNLESDGASALHLDARLTDLAAALLASNGAFRARSNRLGALRGATRAELLRRVARGRDFIESNLDRRLTLDDIARAACLSPFHFHRCFSRAFSEAPHAYVTRRRLERARHLLSASDARVTDIALEVGFESPAAFSRSFRRRFLCSPLVFRKQGSGGLSVSIERP